MKSTMILALLVAAGLHLTDAAASAASHTARDTPAVHLQLIQRMQQQGAWYASLAHVEALRLEHGDSPALLLAQADALRHTGQPDPARELYGQLLRGPHQAAALHGLGLLDASQGQLPSAIDKLRQASRLAPLHVGYLGDLGFALMLAGDHQAARLPLAQAVELSPNDGRSVANAAIWHLVAGNAAEAEAMLEKARLPATTRQHVHATAHRLQQSPATTHTRPYPSAASPHTGSGLSSTPAATDPRAAQAPPATAPGNRTDAAPQPFRPRAPMLEHFASSSPRQGSQP